MIVYGGAEFVKGNLIDELHLFVNPTAMGSGVPIFHQRTNLNLIKPFGVLYLET